MADENKRNRRRLSQGVVVSNKMDKTITVLVERMYKHAKYKKYLRRHTKYHAHDPNNDAGLGDRVEIMECRPLSKMKRFRLVKVLDRAKYAEETTAAAGGGGDA